MDFIMDLRWAYCLQNGCRLTWTCTISRVGARSCRARRKATNAAAFPWRFRISRAGLGGPRSRRSSVMSTSKKWASIHPPQRKTPPNSKRELAATAVSGGRCCEFESVERLDQSQGIVPLTSDFYFHDTRGQLFLNGAEVVGLGLWPSQTIKYALARPWFRCVERRSFHVGDTKFGVQLVNCYHITVVEAVEKRGCHIQELLECQQIQLR